CRLLGRALKGRGIQRLYTSPIERAVRTAQILMEFLGVTPVREAELREMGLGPWEGLSEGRVKIDYPEEWRIWNQSPAALRLDNREPLETVQERILSLVRRWCDIHRGEILAAVSHVALIRCMLLYSMGRSLNEYRSLHIPNSTAFFFEAHVGTSDGALKLELGEIVRPDRAALA
ncbi:MAG: histidine phosphatase family protein, partial [Deltaproteobacteria bacterium]|nr:histidine phosphatase family protein [Deltaproteobacteria bacterium]